MANNFKSFVSTVNPYKPREWPNLQRVLFDSITGSPTGLEWAGTSGPHGIWTPIDVTAAQVASPDALMLADRNATYRLNVAPYTRYYSNGTALVEIGSAVGGIKNIRDFGAVGDGVTDDRAAIAAAITAAGTNGVVFFPPSATAYMCGSKLLLTNNLTLWAYPGTAILKSTAANVSTPLLLSAETGIVSNITVYGLTIDGNVLGQKGGGGAANSSRVCGAVFCNDVAYEKCRFQNTYGTPVNFSINIVRCGVVDCVFSNCGAYNVVSGLVADAFQTVNFIGTGGSFTASISNGSGGAGTVMNVTVASPAPNVTGSFVGVGDLVTGAGVTAGTTVTVQVSGGTGVGIKTVSTSQLVASGLIYTDGSLLSHDNFVINCDFYTCGHDCVNAKHQSGLTVSDNRFYLSNLQRFLVGIGCASVFLFGGQGNVVADNTTWAASGVAIEVSGERSPSITGNNNYNSGTTGIGIHSGEIYGTSTPAKNYGITGNVCMNSGQRNGDWAATWAAGLAFFTADPARVMIGFTISGNTFSDDQATPTQKWGIQKADGGFGVPVVTEILVSSDNLIRGNSLGKWSDASLVAAQQRMIYATGTNVGNTAATTEDTLKTFSVPANTLVNVGDILRIFAGGTFAASTDTKTARVRWGGAAGNIVGSPVGLAVGTLNWATECYIMKTGASTQTYWSLGAVLNASNSGVTGSTGGARTDTAAIDIVVTGQNATNSVAGSVACVIFSVEFIPAPVT